MNNKFVDVDNFEKSLATVNSLNHVPQSSVMDVIINIV